MTLAAMVKNSTGYIIVDVKCTLKLISVTLIEAVNH